jgi:hypothetical protein
MTGKIVAILCITLWYLAYNSFGRHAAYSWKAGRNAELALRN